MTDQPDNILPALLQQVTALRAAIMPRFDPVEERLAHIGDDITVNIARADRAHASADTAREELRALGMEVAALTRKQRRLEELVNPLQRE